MRLLMILFFFPHFAFLQQAEKSFINEFNISCNHSIYNLKQNTFGGGLGAYHSHKMRQHLYLILGLEYNFSKQIQGYEFTGGHTPKPLDTAAFFVSLNTISIPTYFRIQFGTKVKMFIDPGVFIEIIHSSKVGEKISINSGEPEIKAFNSGMFIKPFNFGGNIGVGINFSVNNLEYYIKPEIKYGLFNNRYFRICLGIKID